MTQQNLGQAVLELSTDQGPLDRGLEQARKKTQRVGASMRGLGKKLSLGVTAPILGIGTAAFVAANSIDEAMATLATGTGATGAALEGLEASFTNVFTAVPVSAQEAATAMADLNTMLGLTGSELEEASIVALEAGKAMGIDTSTLIDRTTKAMQQFGVPAEEVTAIMNGMFVTSQNTGIGMDTLASNLQTFGPVLANMGLSLEESTALFGRLNTVGVDATRVFPGINAFMRQAAEDGQDMQASLGVVIERIQGATTVTEALNIATDAFGAEGAQRLTVAIRDGAFALDDLTGAFAGTDGAIMANAEATRTAGEEMAIMKNQITEELAPAGLQLMEAFQSLVPFIRQAIGAVTRLITWFTELSPTMQKVIGLSIGLAAVLAPVLMVLGPIIGAIGTVVGVIGPLIGALGVLTPMLPVLGLAIKALMLTALGPLGIAIAGVGIIALLLITHWEEVSAAAVSIWNGIKDFFIGIWEGIVGIFKDHWDKILAILFPPVGLAVLIAKNWGAIVNIVQSVWDGITGVFKSAINGLIGLAEGFVNFWIAGINGIIGALNSIRFEIPGFDLPFGAGSFGGMSVGVNIPEVPLISLPRLATGGIAMQETAAIVGDVPEAIIPLDRLGTMGSNHIHFHGPVYGQRDFERAVADAGKQLNRRGLG